MNYSEQEYNEKKQQAAASQSPAYTPSYNDIQYGQPPTNNNYHSYPAINSPYHHSTSQTYPGTSFNPTFEAPPSDYSPQQKFQGNPSAPDSKRKSTTYNINNYQPQFHDLWAFVLFYLQLAAFIGVGGYYTYIFADQLRNNSRGSSSTQDQVLKYVQIYLPVIGAALGGTALYSFIVYKFAAAMIIGTFILTIALQLGMASYFVALGAAQASVPLFVSAAITAFVLYVSRRKIPFAAIMLKTTLSIISKYPALILLSPMALIVSIGYVAFFITTLAGATIEHQKRIPDALVVFLIISFYWTAQVIRSVIHTTIAGVFGNYYFVVGSGQTVRNPTVKALSRSLSYSFGSIAFGSLIVAIIQALMSSAKSASDQRSFASLCVQCIVNLLEKLMRYFNMYAFVHVAVYGKSYIQAAKDTWDMIKSRGVDAVINDQLIGTVLGFGIFFIGILSGGIAYLSCLPFRLNTTEISIIVAIAFIIGSYSCSVMTELVQSGVVSTFVCLAEDPEALRRTKPELHSKIAEVYPRILAQ